MVKNYINATINMTLPSEKNLNLLVDIGIRRIETCELLGGGDRRVIRRGRKRGKSEGRL